MRSSSLARVVLATLGVSLVMTLGCGKSPTGESDPDAVTVDFGGSVVNADAGGPVANVRVSVSSWSSPDDGGSLRGTYAKETATSGGDGAFTLPVTLPRDWTWVDLKFTGPAGYDDTFPRFAARAPNCGNWYSGQCLAAADRPAIRMYPTLAIRAGESIEVRVDDTNIVVCGHWFYGDKEPVTCRRVLVAASPGDSVELEVVAHDSSKPKALGFTLRPEDYWFLFDPDMSVRRLIVPAGGVPYVLGAGTATLTARR